MNKYAKIYVNGAGVERDTKEGVYCYGIITAVDKLKPNQSGFVPEIITVSMIDYEPDYIDAYRDLKQVKITNWNRDWLRIREVRRLNK